MREVIRSGERAKYHGMMMPRANEAWMWWRSFHYWHTSRSSDTPGCIA